jgi:hypothetical protein
MTYLKLLAATLVFGWSISASATPHVESVLNKPDLSTEIKVNEMLFTDQIATASSLIQEFATEKLSGYSPSVETFAGPYRLFSTDSSTKLAQTGSSGMMLACLGLMVLMARKRMTL